MARLIIRVRGRVARRLALAFTATALAAAALTAIVVNLEFSARFEGYLATQQHVRAQQVLALLAGDYRVEQGWRAASLDQLVPALVMSGSTVAVLGSDGQPVWSLADAGVDPAMTAVHREMMGVPISPPTFGSRCWSTGDRSEPRYCRCRRPCRR